MPFCRCEVLTCAAMDDQRHWRIGGSQCHTLTTPQPQSLGSTLTLFSPYYSYTPSIGGTYVQNSRHLARNPYKLSDWYLNSQGTRWSASHMTYCHVFTFRLGMYSPSVVHLIPQSSAFSMSVHSHIRHLWAQYSALLCDTQIRLFTFFDCIEHTL